MYYANRERCAQNFEGNRRRNVKKVVLNKRMAGKTVLERIKKTDVEVILLEENQEYELDGLNLSYEETGADTKNAIARVDGEKESAVFLNSLTNEDVAAIYKSGKIIYSTYYSSGTVFSQGKDIMTAINRGKAKQNFFLKDK